MFNVSRIAAVTLAASTIAGAGIFSQVTASVESDGAEVKPLEGFSRSLGSKQAVGYYETKNGACAVTLMVSEALDDTSNVAPPSAARLTVILRPDEHITLESEEARGLSLTCGAGARKAVLKQVESENM